MLERDPFEMRREDFWKRWRANEDRASTIGRTSPEFREEEHKLFYWLLEELANSDGEEREVWLGITRTIIGA